MIPLRPPEKLVIEVKASGRYQRIIWQRNGQQFSSTSSSITPEEFPSYFEIFVRGETTQSDLGLYEITLLPSPPLFDQLAVPVELDFFVVLPGKFIICCTIYIILTF